MAEVSISYKGRAIKTITEGFAILTTGGKYCEDNIIINYTPPELEDKTVSPSNEVQTVVPGTEKDGLSSVTVNAIPSTYIGTGVTKKSSQTYVPTTFDQVIAAGQYLNGAQTILGDADLKAANIKQGVQIFGVTGTYTDPNVVVSSSTWYLDANNILCM